MALKAHAVTIDGEKYFITRVDPFAALRIKSLGLRVIGPIFKALASSETARDFITNALANVEDDKVVESLLGKGVPPALLSIIGMTIDDLAVSLRAEDLEEGIRVTIIGQVSTPHAGVDRVDIGDVQTYFDIMGPRLEKHGAMHQMKLLWKAVLVNLGPTFAGLTTSDPAA